MWLMHGMIPGHTYTVREEIQQSVEVLTSTCSKLLDNLVQLAVGQARHTEYSLHKVICVSVEPFNRYLGCCYFFVKTSPLFGHSLSTLRCKR
jgi:hypothetical protein